MGQHKRNPTAIAAAKGELPLKPRPMGAVESRRKMEAAAKAYMFTKAFGPVRKEKIDGNRDNEYAEHILPEKLPSQGPYGCTKDHKA